MQDLEMMWVKARGQGRGGRRAGGGLLVVIMIETGVEGGGNGWRGEMEVCGLQGEGGGPDLRG